MNNPEATKKALDGAATPTKATEHPSTDNSSKEPTNVIVHIPRPGKSTGNHYVTWADERLPREKTVSLLVTLEDARLMASSSQPVMICESCIVEQAEHYREQQRREEDRQRMIAEQAEISRRRAQEYERQLDLIDAYRRGDEATTKRILEELVQLDDEALKRAGLSSWDEGDDD